MASRTPADETPSHFWEIVIKAGSFMAFALLVACLVIPLRPRMAEYSELDGHGHKLVAERDVLQRDIERRQAELQMLDSDPRFIEIKARDTLDMCQPGELVFRFVDSPASE